MRGRLIALLAGVAAFGAVPSCGAQMGAGGGSPGAFRVAGAFPDYRQAAADQYPQQPPPGNSGSSGPPSGQPGSSNGQGAGHGGGHHHGHASNEGGPARRNAVLGTHSASAAAPVAVPTRPVPAATGSLPFTGSDLSGLVVLALVLIAGGLFTGALARATRRRRRRAPA